MRCLKGDDDFPPTASLEVWTANISRSSKKLPRVLTTVDPTVLDPRKRPAPHLFDVSSAVHLT